MNYNKNLVKSNLLKVRLTILDIKSTWKVVIGHNILTSIRLIRRYWNIFFAFVTYILSHETKSSNLEKKESIFFLIERDQKRDKNIFTRLEDTYPFTLRPSLFFSNQITSFSMEENKHSHELLHRKSIHLQTRISRVSILRG